LLFDTNENNSKNVSSCKDLENHIETIIKQQQQLEQMVKNNHLIWDELDSLKKQVMSLNNQISSLNDRMILSESQRAAELKIKKTSELLANVDDKQEDDTYIRHNSNNLNYNNNASFNNQSDNAP
jgi:septal ring factor EnvC (AmiA/AmiB activator)